MNNGTTSTALIINGSGISAPPAASPVWDKSLTTPLDNGLSASAPHSGASSSTELQRLQQIMRGRWYWAIGTAIFLSLIGGGLGFRFGHKTYASTGQIRVLAVVPKVLYQVDEKGVPPMFDSFIESQVALLQSQRVVELAMQDPAWKPLGRAPSDAGVRNLMHSIEVVHSGELITVRVSDLDPNVAVTSVQTVVGAYQKLYEESDAQSNEKRLMELQNIQNAKGSELAGIREQISNIGRPYGTNDLGHLFELKQSAVEKLENTIAETDTELTAAIRRAGGTHANEQFSPEQWAAVSPEMRDLIHERNQARRNLLLLNANNQMDKSPMFLSAQAVLSIDQKAVDDLATQLQSQRAAGLLTFPPMGTTSANGTETKVPVDADTLRQELTDLHKRLEVARADMIAVGDQQLKISDLKYKEDQAIRDRDAAQQRIDQLNTEATINGRVSVVSSGDRPLAPDKDTRLAYTGAGIFGGAFVGFATILALATVDRRLRSPDETETTVPAVGLLGLLPWLPDDLANAAQAARTAHCVTGVRNTLQLWGGPRDRRAFVVTSPIPGAGKTSLTFALGISYAAAKFKTLIIDCDLVGGGLTARTDKVVTRKLGQLLLQAGRLTEDQLKTALTAAKDQSRRLGDIVIENQWATRAEIDRLLVAQKQQHLGILDALDGVPLDQCVTTTGISRLTLLPVGLATSRDVQLLSAESLKQLIDAARRAYNIVLIDTGPMPGSLEAQLVAAVADGVVVVVSPGVHRPLVRRCVERLFNVGAQVAGVVYNRASESDVFVYSSGSQPRAGQTSTVQHNVPDASEKPSNPSAEKLGPLASAVSRSAPDDRPRQKAL